MRKLDPRFWIIVFGGIALLALILISASLDTLQLAPGKPFPFEQVNPFAGTPASSEDPGAWVMAVIRIMMVIFWILLPFFIVYLIISKDARKRFLRDMMMVIPVLLILYLLTNSSVGKRATQDMEGRFGMQMGETTGAEQSAPTMPEFTPPPGWVTTVTSIVLAVGITMIVLALAFAIWRRARERALEMEPIRQIELQAQDALDALHAGGNLKETIQRCYLQMVETLLEYKNIQLGHDMTPHEFELLLERRGLPRDPVHQLTHLFEQVRYGTQVPGREEERLAISSLSAIVSACQRSRGK